MKETAPCDRLWGRWRRRVNPLNQPVVLVAEDREDDVILLRRSFEHVGFDTPVQYVRDGEQAIAYLAGKGRFANRDEYPLPSMLLLDLKMPRKNGFEVLEWIQQQPNLAELRTIVLTTSEDVVEVNRAYKLGAASFLTKPLNFTEFKDTIVAVHGYWLTLNKPPAIKRAQNLSPFNPYQLPAGNK
jgi:CheY-like chemotaxis protein